MWEKVWLENSLSQQEGDWVGADKHTETGCGG